MKRVMVLAIMAAVAAGTTAQSAPAAVPLAEQMTAFAGACDNLAVRLPDLTTRAKAAGLTAWAKKDLAKVAPIVVPAPAVAGQDAPGEATKLKSDVVQAWWLDAGHTASLVYQEATQAPSGQRWRSCVVSGQAPDASAVIKAILTLNTKPSPDSNTDLTGKTVAITFASASGTQAGALMAQFDTSLPFPDMTFILVKQDPHYAQHTPHPIAVTEAELYQASARPGIVAFKRESPVGK